MNHLSYRHRGSSLPLLGQPIFDFLSEVATRFPQQEAVVSIAQNQRLTYAVFYDRVDQLARGLLAMGVERGDRVGIWSTNNVEWLLLQIATARLGAVLVNINPAYRTGELTHAINAAGLNVLFLIPAFRKSNYVEMILELCPECHNDPNPEFSKFPSLREIVVYDPENAAETHRPAQGMMLWSEVLSAGDTVTTDELNQRSQQLDVDDPINIQFTSGTTGFAKPVVLSHHNLLNNAYSVSEILGFNENDRLCVPVPFYHCFGMVLANLVCLSRGATIVIPAPHFEAEAVLKAVASERCTALHGVPTMFVAELEYPSFDQLDLSSLRTGIMAGAPCPPELMRRVINDLGCREILIAYGQTEASPVTHITRPDDAFERRVNTVGTNLPHQEVKVINPESGAVMPIGEQGELCFRGYHVMQGYYGQEEATKETIDTHGWLHSGDLGEMDADGYVRITGRLKDMIIRGGENIYPAEIEAYLNTHPKVAQSAVFGMPHERWGEQVVAWVQLHENTKAEPQEIIDFAARGLAHYKKPSHVEIVDEFPLTVTGKIQKYKMREAMTGLAVLS